MSELVDQIAKLEAKANQLKDSVSYFKMVSTSIQCNRIRGTLMSGSAKRKSWWFEKVM